MYVFSLVLSTSVSNHLFFRFVSFFHSFPRPELLSTYLSIPLSIVPSDCTNIRSLFQLSTYFLLPPISPLFSVANVQGCRYVLLISKFVIRCPPTTSLNRPPRFEHKSPFNCASAFRVLRSCLPIRGGSPKFDIINLNSFNQVN